MMSKQRRKQVGFDRKIQLEWLDATADGVGQGLSAPALRSRLENVLEGQVAGKGPRNAREKTITVLLHVWCLVPPELAPLRDDGLVLIQASSGRKRLPVHWGMCVATYPFFRDVASTIGRLIGLQGTVALSQVTRRTTETWGERSTVIRATRRIVRSLVQWNVLDETGERGVFRAAPRLTISRGDPIGHWLLEAGMSNSDRKIHPLRSLLTSAAFFPYELNLSPHDIASSSRLELHHQGPNEDVVTLKGRTA